MIGYASVAQTYRDKGWTPIPLPAGEKKSPPSGTTGRDGTVSDFNIVQWSSSAKHRDGNVALRAEGWIAIDVDAYDGKVGDLTIRDLEAQLGELPVTITSTAREPWTASGEENPSRQHFYRVPERLSFVTTLQDVEIVQHRHRYSVVHPSVHPNGSVYTWYDEQNEPLDELPSLDDLEWLPEAWLLHLAIPDEVSPRWNGYTGEVHEWLSAIEDTDLTPLMRQWVASIPSEDFGHNEMIEMQASLVNLAAQGQEGVKLALDALRSQWLRGPYDTEQYRHDWDTSLAGAIAKFGALPPGPRDIPNVDHADLLATFDDLYEPSVTLPTVTNPASLEERVRRVMSAAYEQGCDMLQAAALGWQSAAAKAPGGMRDGVDERESSKQAWTWALETFVNPVTDERLFANDEQITVKPKVISAPAQAVSLMTASERERRRSVRWWGDEFMEVQAQMHPVMSEQYYHLNRWMILSLCFAHKAVIPFSDGTTAILNFYGATVGPSGTGKSDSMNCLQEMARMFWEGAENPDIGGDATAAALTQALIRRDGLPSLFHSDEADAVLRNWSNEKGEFHGMKQRVTEIFTGKVPAIQRAMQREISGIHARAYLNVHLTGIDYKIADAIEPDDWTTGFVNRFVWAKGERKHRSRESKRLKVRKAGESAGGKSQINWYGQWVARFHMIERQVLDSPDGQPVWLDVDDDVLDRHVGLLESFEAIAQNSAYEERLEPTFTRLERTVLKCAALVAITQKRRHVTMDDYIVALEQAEEWVTNVMEMVSATDMPPKARQAERLWEWLHARTNHQAPLPEVNRHSEYRGRSDYLLSLMKELRAQGRIEEMDMIGGVKIIRAIGDEDK